MGQKRTVKDYPRLFGAIAEKKGSITEEQLTKALKIQGMEDREKKAHRFIGIILYDEGLMTTEQTWAKYESRFLVGMGKG